MALPPAWPGVPADAIHPDTPVVEQGAVQPGTSVALPMAPNSMASDYSTGMPASAPSGAAAPSLTAPGYSVDFKDGVLFKTNDGLFSLRVNNLLQVDYRDFAHTAGDTHTPTSLHDNFTVSREWLYFRGNVTEYLDYQTVIAAGAAASPTGPSTVNLLDAYLDFNPFGADVKELFQFRVGRFKTPFLYQFYTLSPQDFISPELSMFGTNYLQNRQMGAMAHGKLFQQRLEYAAGMFNGAPNSYEVTFNNREAVLFLGYTPFLHNEGSIFQNLMLVGSYANGRQFGPAIPARLTTAVPAAGPPDNSLISPTFTTFAPAAIQNGPRTLWDLEVLWAYKSFNFYGEYDAGNVSYGLATDPTAQVPVSVSGWSAAATYFFTGEEITLNRRRVQPLRHYNWKCGGCGALEGYARYSNLVLGSNVLTSHVASPLGNASGVNATDVGVNWYLNQYVKIVFDWQHGMFNAPVMLAPERAIKTEDMFWTRFQLYY